MKTVTLDVRSPETAMAEALAAAKSGKPQKSPRISFATPASPAPAPSAAA